MQKLCPNCGKIARFIEKVGDRLVVRHEGDSFRTATRDCVVKAPKEETAKK